MKRLLFSILLCSLTLLVACGDAVTTRSTATTPGESVEGMDGVTAVAYADNANLKKARQINDRDQLIGEGDLLNGQKHGTWITYHPKNGLVETVIGYKNGVPHGAYLKASDRGYVLEKGFYNNGQIDGEFRKYIRSKVKEESTFVNGQLDGVRKVYYDDGKIMSEENYDMGKKDGKFTYYNQEGEVKFEQNYAGGEKVE